MIVTFTNQKGGVGKTTLAVILAQAAIETGLTDIVMVDLDTLQHNFTDIMHSWNANIKVYRTIPDDANERAFVVIDTPPAMGAETEKAITLANVVVAPIDRGISSIAGLQNVIFKNPKTIIVINKFNAKKSMDREIYNTAVSKFGSTGIPVIVLPENAWINNNINYRTTWNSNMASKQEIPFIQLITMILSKR